FLASTPFFSDTTCVQIGCLFQFRQSPADGLGIALQHAGDVPDPTMPQLRGLDGGIPPTIVFGQRVVQALHHPFDSRCMRVHAKHLPLVALQSKDLISYSLKIRKLFSSRSYAVRRPRLPADLGPAAPDLLRAPVRPDPPGAAVGREPVHGRGRCPAPQGACRPLGEEAGRLHRAFRSAALRRARSVRRRRRRPDPPGRPAHARRVQARRSQDARRRPRAALRPGPLPRGDVLRQDPPPGARRVRRRPPRHDARDRRPPAQPHSLRSDPRGGARPEVSQLFTEGDLPAEACGAESVSEPLRSPLDHRVAPGRHTRPTGGGATTMKTHLNTLFVTTQGAYLARRGLTLIVRSEGKTLAQFPLHTLDGVVCFGRVACSPMCLAACAEKGVSVSFLSLHGRFLASVQGPITGNVLLRRKQYRAADDPAVALEVSRHIVAAKVANARTVLLRASRDAPAADSARKDVLLSQARTLAALLVEVPGTSDLDKVRGLEGEAASQYFQAFNALQTTSPTPEGFAFTRRSRQPPLDRLNALLSFLYTLLLHDIRSACEA